MAQLRNPRFESCAHCWSSVPAAQHGAAWLESRNLYGVGLAGQDHSPYVHIRGCALGPTALCPSAGFCERLSSGLRVSSLITHVRPQRVLQTFRVMSLQGALLRSGAKSPCVECYHQKYGFASLLWNPF